MKTRLTKYSFPPLADSARALIGTAVEIKWGTSRGRDSYGYTTASLYHSGRRIAACNGGGYDMRGTVLGNFVAWAFADQLRALKPSQMPNQSHWESDNTRVCAGRCKTEAEAAWHKAIAEAPEGADLGAIERAILPRLADDCYTCPTCGGQTRNSGDGRRVEDGRSFYGLRFVDPHYNPGKARIGRDCSDRTLGTGAKGKTVEQAEAAGESFGLERLQAAYAATAPHATRRHTVPSIDGACGESCVMDILRACGFTLDRVHDSAKRDVYVIRELTKEERRYHVERVRRD